MLKRSQLARKTPLTARKPISRGKPMKTRPKRKAVSDKRWRSPEYLAFVRSLPCSLCAMGPCDAHHLIGMWQVGGMGLKASDALVIPLCRKHHDDTHRYPELQAAQPTWLRWTITKGMAAFDGETRGELRKALAFIDEKEGVTA